MTNPRGYASPEEALAAISNDTAGAGPAAEAALAWQREVESLTGSGTALEGRVRVVVDIQGMLTSLVVADSVASRGGRVVTAAVGTALRAAQESVRARAAASAESMWGPASATAEAFRGEVERATPLVEVEPLGDDGPGPGSTGSMPGSTPGGTW